MDLSQKSHVSFLAMYKQLMEKALVDHIRRKIEHHIILRLVEVLEREIGQLGPTVSNPEIRIKLQSFENLKSRFEIGLKSIESSDQTFFLKDIIKDKISA